MTRVSAPAPPPPSALEYNWHYEFDGLYRLAYACPEWDPATSTCLGDAFTYSYDAVGNRLSETVGAITTNYTYDIANRLTDVNGVTYTWDNNGNLLSDGVNSYAYDHANRLLSITTPQSTINNQYNGLGDRLRQTVDSVTTNYTLDLNNWLTQVLADGTHTYLYGTGRIAQYDVAGVEYFLGDELGSVRQLADFTGAITLVKIYQPYGSDLNNTGTGASAYGFTGEWTDSYIELLYLRSRYYDPYLNQFIQPDPIVSDYSNPQNLNAYSYVRNNPVNLTDPAGLQPDCDKRVCGTDATDWLLNEMKTHYDYGVQIRNSQRRMKDLALQYLNNRCTPFGQLPVFLVEVATDSPFQEIVTEFPFPKTNISIGITPLIYQTYD